MCSKRGHRLDQVSIHAPWEGCDATAWMALPMALCFNSRTLGRVRREVTKEELQKVVVSIHAPWEGCDGSVAYGSSRCAVSIHAPWEGCDGGCRPSYDRQGGFNSRTLGRVRLANPFLHTQLPEFQFTHPGKGATLISSSGTPSREFQFTHPGKGATAWSARSKHRLSCFNSRTLGRVRLTDYHMSVDQRVFQFTHPGKGATF